MIMRHCTPVLLKCCQNWNHTRWPPGKSQGSSAKNRIITCRYEADEVWGTPGQTEGSIIRQKWKCQNAQAGSHPSVSDKVGIVNCLYTEEELRLTLSLRLLQKAQFSFDARFVFYSTFGWVRRLVGKRYDPLYTGRQPLWLPRWYCQRIQRENLVFVTW